MAEQHRYVVAYDVTEDGVRRRVRKTCRAYGGRRQYSLFEVYLSAHQRAELIAKLEEIISVADDPAVIKVYSVGPERQDTLIGNTKNNDVSNIV